MRDVRTWTCSVRYGIALLFSVLLISSPVVASGQSVTATWDPSPPSEGVTEYQVCIGTTSMSCNVQLASVNSSQTSYSFTPTGGVIHYVAVRAVNPSGPGAYSTQSTFSIPSFTQPVNQSSQVSVAITALTMAVSDPDGNTLTFTHTGLPAGLALNAATGRVTGTPSAAGTYNVTIFVTDALVTVSRSFVWTVTTPAADTTPPALSITSHTNGQTVTSGTVTISGTATDSGRGGNGVASVTVNGQATTGGTATGSATASWSRASVALSQGANTITVQAADTRGNTATQSITLNYSIAPVSSATLSASVASPQNTGSAVTFTAAGSGGVGPRQYKFLVQQAGGAAQVVQNWSTSTTYSWTPSTAASYTVIVWARSAGITVDAAQASAQMSYVVNTPPPAAVASVALSPSLATPQNAGTAITFTAVGVGGVAPRQYKFLVSQGGGANQLVQDWSTLTTYTWAPSSAGSYAVTVWARSAGVTTDAPQAQAQVAYVINTAPVSSATLTPNIASPRAAGSAIAFTASGSGGVAPYQFKFLVQPAGGSALVVQNWSTATTYTWTPAEAGTYTVSVWVRSAGVMTNAAQASAQTAYTISAANVTAVSASPATGSGASQTFAFKYSDSRGATNLTSEWAWFTGGTGACMAYHERATNRVYLLDDGGASWSSQVLGTNTTLQNSSCSIGVAASSTSVSGTDLTLNLAVAFTSAFNGSKTVKMFANANNGLSSGWQDRGVWTVSVSAPAPTPPPAPAPPAPAPPPPSVPAGVSAVDISPGSGSGSAQTFTLRYSDTRGASSLTSEWVWLVGGTGVCMAYHERATNLVYLLNDAGTAWNSQILGASSVLQGSSCAINLASSSVSTSGSVLTLNLAMTFTPAFSGAKTVRMFANAAGGVSSGWQDRGTWTVTSSAPAPTPTPPAPTPTPTPTPTPPTPTPPAPPTVQPGVNAVSVTPGSGSGSSETFVLQYSDSRGARSLLSEWVWFSGGTGVCMIYHERTTNTVYLINDAGTGWITGTIATPTALQNSSCAVNLGASSVSLNGPVLTLNLAIGFKAPFRGTKNIAMFASALGEVTTGWQNRGSWIVP